MSWLFERADGGWLAGPLALLLLASGGAAEPAGPYALPAVVVSASRLDDGLSSPTRDVLVLDAADIEARAAASITELLGSLPGIDARTRGPWGVQADLEIDGSTFSQVVLLVDGVRVNDPQTGHHNLNLPLVPADLERLEVLYGGGSAVHGPDALGGVINLVPRARVTARADVAARWGGTLDDGATGVASDADLRWGWGGDWGSAWVSGGKRRSDGYRAGTDFDEERGFVHARLPLAGGVLSLQGGVQDKVFGASQFYAAFPSREWTTAQLASAAFQGRDLSLRLFARRHRDRFVLIADDPSVYENRHRSLLAGVEGHGRVAIAGGRLIVGGEAARESIDSSNLGDHARLRLGAFTEFGRRLSQAWQLTAGLRADHHEGFGWEASPSVGVARRLGAGRLFASVTRSYRAPSYTELYYQDRANLGDPDLGAERAWQAEVGGDAVRHGVRLEAALFARRETNLVDYVRTSDYAAPGDAPPWQAQNLGEMETTGLRLRARRQWRGLAAEAGYSWIDKEQTLAPGLESKYVFSHPTHQLSGRLRHRLLAGATAEWQLTGRQRLAPLDDYRLLDLTVGHDIGPGRVLLRLRNLTDEAYESIVGVPMPGRWFGLETQVEL